MSIGSSIDNPIVAASSSTTVAIADDNTTNATVYPTFVTANTGNLPEKVSSTGLKFNPSTGTLSPTNVQSHYKSSDGSSGFTGTGTFVTFTIKDGIIVNAV